MKPVYLLAGGRGPRRKTPDPLIQAIFRECGVPEPSVAYIGAASGDDRSFFNFITSALKEAGAGEVKHAIIVPDKADLPKARHIMETADIIFISGGDVEAGMDVLQKRDMVEFLTGLYNRGKTFFGVSAGSIILGREWVRWQNPDDESSAEIFPCLGIAPIICDTHDEDSDWGELKSLLALEKNGVKGYGIPSGAALKVYPDSRVAAIGAIVLQYEQLSDKVKKSADVLPFALSID